MVNFRDQKKFCTIHILPLNFFTLLPLQEILYILLDRDIFWEFLKNFFENFLDIFEKNVSPNHIFPHYFPSKLFTYFEHFLYYASVNQYFYGRVRITHQPRIFGLNQQPRFLVWWARRTPLCSKKVSVKNYLFAEEIRSKRYLPKKKAFLLANFLLNYLIMMRFERMNYFLYLYHTLRGLAIIL